MQTHMMANIRTHLENVDTILHLMSTKQLDQASNIAEQSLGKISLNLHNASHMEKFMPKGMQKAASQLTLKTPEGDVDAAYKRLGDVTAAYLACHASYRIR